MELQDKLQSALPAYTLERELGGGGMSRVFLAHDRELNRRVVVKVLPPDLAVEISAERFRREIQVAAQLQHPHIVPVLSAGTHGELMYYVMPFIDGESLRAYISRARQLPIDEAVKITGEVADALDYAHRHGIVHRDIKPDNILLEDGHAVVTDFGIARALSQALTNPAITTTGLTLGTPRYMSPEQASADREVDGRSDIYSLGCVLYEMLAGEPPFTGASAQVVIAKRLTGPAPSVRVSRRSVSPALDAVVARALAPAPADRFATAKDLARALAQPQVTESSLAAASTHPSWGRRIALAGVAAAVLVGVVALARRGTSPARSIDENVVAVVPFRVAGADPSLAYLREGMVDLLAAKLTGEGGAQAADPRTVLSAWQRAAPAAGADPTQESALRLAEQLGAGHVLLGGVVGTSSSLVITATLLRVPTGGERVEASVEGSADSLPALIDRLVLQLLAKEAGESERLTSLTSTSLVALKSYLEGQASYRQGRYDQSVRQFERALEADSTFVLAAVGLFSAAYWTPSNDIFERGKRLAWMGRHRLSARDRAYVLAWTGPKYPVSPSFRETLDGWKHAVETAPDRAEPWFELGDIYFHFGAILGVDSERDLARSAFNRALALDSAFAAPLAHLVELAVAERDTTRARLLGSMYFARDSAADGADYLRWRVAHALRDSSAVAALISRIERISTWSLRRMVGFAQLDDVGMSDVQRAARTLRARGSTPSEARLIHFELRNLALNRGRPSEALVLTRAFAEVEPYSDAHLDLQILDALFAQGDSSAAAEAVRRLTALDAAQLRGNASTAHARASHLCARELWSLTQGRSANTVRAIADLAQAGSDGGAEGALDHEICSATLAVMRELGGGQRGQSGDEASARLTRALDRIGTATFGGTPVENIGRLVLARALERRGDLTGAIRVLRRRPYQHFGVTYLATALREEARLAEQAGDRQAAIAALRHYLGLRRDPEPVLRGEVEGLRSTLQRLESGERGP